MTRNANSPVKFGPWLKSQLRLRDWNQSEFALRAGVKPGVVSHWVRGQRTPGPDSITKIADALDIDKDHLLVMVGYRDPDLTMDPESATAQLMPLIEKIDWDSDPGRLEGVRMILQGYLEVDRRRKAQQR